MATATATKKRVRINGCVAAAQAAKYADVDVITAYPIRPYTATMMALAQMVANGELDAECIVADSEHSQLSIAHGAASSGARVFTGSSGVGVQFAVEARHEGGRRITIEVPEVRMRRVAIVNAEEYALLREHPDVRALLDTAEGRRA